MIGAESAPAALLIVDTKIDSARRSARAFTIGVIVATAVAATVTTMRSTPSGEGALQPNAASR